MMIDTSALLAVVWNEPEAQRLAEAVNAAPTRRISTVSWLEAMLVSESRSGPAAAASVLMTLADLEVEAVAFDQAQMFEAHAAWQRFGKGRHPAALNLGDCCAYAAAVTLGEPLLFKGADFARTDITAASW
ncbi:MAG: type II toxin-antitoxin system VapC family toxin [Terriglobales bacterium]